jgi:solute carrier family 25 (mitochondrial iron transporter), member 28/37
MMCLYPKPNAEYKGITDVLIRFVREEGEFRPVRGISVVAFGAGPAHALYFSCYELIKRKLSSEQKAGDNPVANFKE